MLKWIRQRLSRLRQRLARFIYPEVFFALVQMVEEKAAYMRLNNLGNPAKQHTIKAARAALK